MDTFALTSDVLARHLTAYAADLQTAYWRTLDADIVDWPTADGLLARLRAVALILGKRLDDLI